MHAKPNTLKHTVIHIYQTLRSGRIWHNVNFFKRSLTGLNSEFSFSKTSCFTKAEEFSLPYYLLIAGGIISGFIPFPRVLVLCEMQSVSSRIWTHIGVSISYDNNNYTRAPSMKHIVIECTELVHSREIFYSANGMKEQF